MGPSFAMSTKDSSRAYSVVVYTTLYREGGPKFERAAQTKAAELRAAGQRVICKAVESKRDFVSILQNVGSSGNVLDELHFFGHSGMYGIMFGTRQWPEQFSPHEWRTLELPTTPESKLYFHACRSGRWFAPFIARTLNVTAFGYHNYTTVSLSKTNFVWDGWGASSDNLYIIACPGKKSHGLMASLIKYLGFVRADEMVAYHANQGEIDTSYESVAELYDSTFEDIVVRKDELNWLEKKLSGIKPQNVLDIGCGNGAFLSRLSPQFECGTGVDLSEGMLKTARARHADNKKLQFTKIDGPKLPFDDNTFDVVTSTLSFRYLDWDPMMLEILRVLKPGGRFLVLDMVAAPVRINEWGKFLISKFRMMKQRIFYRQYYQALKKLVTSRGWQKMLQHNPIRSEHEMRWYLESRFQGNQAEIINVGAHSRILAFDSGAIHFKTVEKLSYP
jgi:ubiquinone/menaquinone biosynthesis C-methylase UbiE